MKASSIELFNKFMDEPDDVYIPESKPMECKRLLPISRAEEIRYSIEDLKFAIVGWWNIHLYNFGVWLSRV